MIHLDDFSNNSNFISRENPNEAIFLSVTSIFFTIIRYNSELDSLGFNNVRRLIPLPRKLDRVYLLMLWFNTMVESEKLFHRHSNLTQEEAKHIENYIHQNYGPTLNLDVAKIRMDEFERRMDIDATTFLAFLKTLQPAEKAFFFNISTPRDISNHATELKSVQEAANRSRQEQHLYRKKNFGKQNSRCRSLS